MDPSPSTAAPENVTAPVVATQHNPHKGEEEGRNMSPSSSTAAPGNAPAAVLATQHNRNKREDDARTMSTSSSIATPGNVPAPVVATRRNGNKREEELEARNLRASSSTAAPGNVPAPLVAIQHNVPAPATQRKRNKREEEEARNKNPSSSTATPGNVPAPATQPQRKRNKREEEEARNTNPSSSTAAPGNVPAAATQPTRKAAAARNVNPSSSTAVAESVPPRVMVCGLSCHVVVTNNADEASAWVRGLPEEEAGKIRIIGVSSYVLARERSDGFVFRRVFSLHLCFLLRVLIYHLVPPERSHSRYSPEVLNFLRHPANVFVGPNVDQTLYLLGLPFPTGYERTADLDRVAQLLSSKRPISAAAQRTEPVPLHVSLADTFLGFDEHLRVDWGSRTYFKWPLSKEQVDFAVQEAVIAENVGIRVDLAELCSGMAF